MVISECNQCGKNFKYWKSVPSCYQCHINKNSKKNSKNCNICGSYYRTNNKNHTNCLSCNRNKKDCHSSFNPRMNSTIKCENTKDNYCPTCVSFQAKSCELCDGKFVGPTPIVFKSYTGFIYSNKRLDVVSKTYDSVRSASRCSSCIEKI